MDFYTKRMRLKEALINRHRSYSLADDVEVLNCTLHRSTNTQREMGVVDMKNEARKFIKRSLVFDTPPTVEDMKKRASKIVTYVSSFYPNIITVMLGGSPFFMPILEKTFKERGYAVTYSFSQRKSIEYKNGVKKSEFVFEDLILV